MNKAIFDYLETLALSEIEAKFYLALLESGSMTVRDLAHKVGIGRTSAYPYIELLLEKELIIKTVKGSRTQIAVNPPIESLQHLIEQKTQNLKTIKEGFPAIAKMLSASLSQGDTDNDAEIRHYKGKLGVKKIYEEALQANELRTYVLVAETGGIFPDNVKMFNTAFKQNPTLTVQEMIYDSPLATKDAEQLLAKNDRYSFKLMPKDLKLSAEDILIYDGTVAFINYKGNISSIVLKNIDNYRNAKELFDFIWKILP